MTERKSFKRQVRSRTAKTGERYTAARVDWEDGATCDLVGFTAKGEAKRTLEQA